MKTNKLGKLFYFLTLAMSIGSLALSIINFYKYKEDLKPVEENDPDIYLTGLKGMEIKYDTRKLEYNDGISNLGKTGRIIFECYAGKCTYEYSYSCDDDVDVDTGYDFDSINTPNIHNNYTFMKKNFNISKLDTCYGYNNYIEHTCSYYCRTTKEDSCGRSNCHKDTKEDYFHSASCILLSPDNFEDEENINSKSCNAINLIYFWKKIFFEKLNATTYGKYKYSNSAIPPNEKCEDTGRKMCGILDSFGNKLCYEKEDPCPINFVTKNKSEIEPIDPNYSTLTIPNIGDIYYTNKLTETGKVAGGFYVDTDLLIRYTDKDCEVFDTGDISELLDNHFHKLYVNDLDFDPYSDKDIDKKGKAYLKLCTPEPDKERDLAKLKVLVSEYNKNVTFNENYVRGAKQLFKIAFYIGVGGYVVYFFYMIILFGVMLSLTDECCCNWYCDCMYYFLFIALSVPSFVLVGSAITSMCLVPKLNFDVKDVLDVDLDKSIYNSLLLTGALSFCLTILLVCSTYGVVYYFSILRGKPIPKPVNNYMSNYNNLDRPLTQDEIKGGFILH